MKLVDMFFFLLLIKMFFKKKCCFQGTFFCTLYGKTYHIGEDETEPTEIEINMQDIHIDKDETKDKITARCLLYCTSSSL